MTLTATPTQRARPIRAQFPTLTRALDYAADGATGFNFYDGRGELTAVLPFEKLKADAVESAHRLAGLGLERGSRVAIVATTEPGFHVLFFACHYAGLTPVPLPPPLQLGGRHEYAAHLRRLLTISRARLCIGPAHCDVVMREASFGLQLKFVGSFEIFSGLTQRIAPTRPSAESDPAYLQFTSGSTRFPRGVKISNRALMANLQRTTEHLEINDDDRAVSWLPYYHDMGLVGLVLAPIATQMSVDYLGSREFAMRPRQWLIRMSESRATISFAPPFGYELATRRTGDSTLEQIDLSAWRIAGVGADHIRPQVLTAFAERTVISGFDRRAFLPCYGLAESTLAVTLGQLRAGIESETIDREHFASTRYANPADRDGEIPAGMATSVFVDCGRPLAGHALEIRGADGTPLPDRHCGDIFVRGASTMSGYVGDDASSSDERKSNEWLETGDVGYVVDGRLFVTGRAKDMMISNGRNIWPQDLESVAERIDGIRTGDASAFPVPDRDGREQLVMVVQCRQTDTALRLELIRRLRGAITRELGVDCLIDLVPPRTLSRTSSGKQSRATTRAEYLMRRAADPLHATDLIAAGNA